MKLIEAAEYKIARLLFRFFGGPYGLQKEVTFFLPEILSF